jgi:hypothetical protein
MHTPSGDWVSSYLVLNDSNTVFLSNSKAEYFTRTRDHERVKIRQNFTFIRLKSFFPPPIFLKKGKRHETKGRNKILTMYILSERLEDLEGRRGRENYLSRLQFPEARLMTNRAESLVSRGCLLLSYRL